MNRELTRGLLAALVSFAVVGSAFWLASRLVTTRVPTGNAEPTRTPKPVLVFQTGNRSVELAEEGFTYELTGLTGLPTTWGIYRFVDLEYRNVCYLTNSRASNTVCLPLGE